MQQERSTRGFSFFATAVLSRVLFSGPLSLNLGSCRRTIQASFLGMLPLYFGSYRHALQASFFRHALPKPRLVAVLSFKLRFTRFQQVLTASHCLQKELWIEQLLLGMGYLHIAFKKKLGEGGWCLILPSNRAAGV